jgi:hypothetical protein
MDVYIVQCSGDHEYFGIEGVFYTREAAVEHLQKMGLHDVGGGYWMSRDPYSEGYEIECHSVQ